LVCSGLEVRPDEEVDVLPDEELEVLPDDEGLKLISGEELEEDEASDEWDSASQADEPKSRSSKLYHLD
jgi:hypothetical protein